MSRWITVALVCVLPIGCISQREYDDMKGQYETQIEGLKGAVAAHERHSAELEREVSYQKSRAGVLESENDALGKANALLEAQRKELEGKLQGLADMNSDIFEKTATGFSMKGDASFDAGLATLRPKAMAALDALASELRTMPNVMIRIDGHTDNDPIVKTKYKWTTGSNFELAAARALSVLLHFEKQGIAGSQMHMTSFGEHAARVANDTKENKAKNRRVEIHIGTMAEPTHINGHDGTGDHK